MEKVARFLFSSKRTSLGVVAEEGGGRACRVGLVAGGASSGFRLQQTTGHECRGGQLPGQNPSPQPPTSFLD